ncbi:MAG: hypothetical protein ACYTG1_02730 [Planctomycetota bacterium]|jgi:hypothetical protein
MTRSEAIGGSARTVAGGWSRLGAVEARWTASALPGRGEDADGRPCEIVVTLRVVDPRRALAEAWLESKTRRRRLLRRQPVACRVAVADGLLHVDAEHAGRRVLALTLPDQGDGPVYARSDLVGEAGLPGGSFDPPVVRRLADARDAATA